MNVTMGEPGSDRQQRAWRERLIGRARAWLAPVAVIGVGALSLVGSAGSTTSGPVAALVGGQATANPPPRPTQCVPSDPKGCFNKDPRLGPEELPAIGPAGSVDAYIGKITQGYLRFDHLTEALFLAKFWDVPEAKAKGFCYSGYKKGWCYPPDGGFELANKKPVHRTMTLQPTENGKPVFLDRFGAETGTFLAPALTPYGKRALPPMNLDTFHPASHYNYHLYKVVKPFTVDAGPIAPWFGQVGKGLQYVTCVATNLAQPCSSPNVADLLKRGDLQEERLPLR